MIGSLHLGVLPASVGTLAFTFTGGLCLPTTTPTFPAHPIPPFPTPLCKHTFYHFHSFGCILVHYIDFGLGKHVVGHFETDRQTDRTGASSLKVNVFSSASCLGSSVPLSPCATCLRLFAPTTCWYVWFCSVFSAEGIPILPAWAPFFMLACFVGCVPYGLGQEHLLSLFPNSPTHPKHGIACE